ncbi:hypothetical protein Tco_0891118 [Tanacetum coccineum]|uniref:Uncharacterized protein n=1 Tax=Tanacetum coccineum TaxID=301880 RepID=A0ABQ5C5D4_9ASTR
MDSEATNASTQQNLELMDEEFTTTAYPNVQDNLKLPTEDQDTSSVPPMTSSVIDLIVSYLVSTMIHAPLPTSTATVIATTTTTSLPPPPPQPQQSTTDPILVRRIGELEQHMADLVSKAVDEIVTDVVDWAMQAPLRARFRDLPAVDMKEILQQRMFEDKSYYLDEARKKKRKRRESPRTSPGSPHSHPPPLPPPAGASGALGLAQQQGSKALSSSKTAASTHQSMAWTTSDTRYELTGFTATQETSPSDDLMQDDSILDE